MWPVPVRRGSARARRSWRSRSANLTLHSRISQCHDVSVANDHGYRESNVRCRAYAALAVIRRATACAALSCQCVSLSVATSAFHEAPLDLALRAASGLVSGVAGHRRHLLYLSLKASRCGTGMTGAAGGPGLSAGAYKSFGQRRRQPGLCSHEPPRALALSPSMSDEVCLASFGSDILVWI